MEIQTRQAKNATVVSAFGKIDAMTAPAFESSLTDLIEDGALRMVLDLGGVVYISSAGLRVILAAAKALKSHVGVLVLAGAGGSVKEVLDISGFGSVFSIYDTVDAAVEAVG
jgi:anti-anti-sigma factor